MLNFYRNLQHECNTTKPALSSNSGLKQHAIYYIGLLQGSLLPELTTSCWRQLLTMFKLRNH